MEHFPQVPGSIRLDSDALGRMHPQPSQKASDRQRQQAISQRLSSTAISRGLIEAIPQRYFLSGTAWSSTAISRGLIEACWSEVCRTPTHSHPRRSAVASLKHAAAAEFFGLAGGHPRRSAVASLKLGGSI